MTLSLIYARAARQVAAGILALIMAAVISALIGDALPAKGGESAVVIAGLAIAGLAAASLAVATLGHRAQAALWALALMGAVVARGGLEGPGFSRPLILLAAVIAFVMAVVATLLQADEAVAKPRDRS